MASPTHDPASGGTVITVVGAGYVGLVTAAGFAEQGHRVHVFDNDPRRVAALRRLELPIAEPGLREAIAGAGERLTFHDTAEDACPASDFVFVAVPTPLGGDGQADLAAVESAIAWLGPAIPTMARPPVIVIRSTAPPGTADRVRIRLKTSTSHDVPVVSNPEFLQEGRALADFRAPSRVLVGCDHGEIAARVAALYAFTGAECFVTDSRSAELAKYGANAFLALRISFANELARLGELLGADVDTVLAAVGRDPRIGSHYLRPGMGYGGSCLPKDIAALVAVGDAAGSPMLLATATRAVNEAQRAALVEALGGALGGFEGQRVALLGLAFKPDTNDIREAPALHLAAALHEAGARVAGWDPSVTAEQIEASAYAAAVEHTHDLYGALAGAQAAVLCTEWPEAVDLDFARAAAVMAGTTLVDGRYGWDSGRAMRHGLRVLRIGSKLE